jgi:carbonic anhydrase
MKGIQRFLEGYQSFVDGWGTREAETLRALANGQAPDAIVISCSDSRVIPELITQADPGTLFVVRNVGNLIPPVDSHNPSVSAAIAYAVDHLHVRHLIVLGHTQCGAMAATRALCTHADTHLDPAIENWLAFARDSWDELVAAGTADAADWHDRLAEENVLQQLANALAYPAVAKAVSEGRIALHAWIYDVKAAELRCWDPQSGTFTAANTASGAGTITAAQVRANDQVSAGVSDATKR